jgi:AraC family transcriptional regulator
MIPRIEIIPEKKIIGKRLKMSLSEDKTYELWHGFMSERKFIKNCSTKDLISIQIYNDSLDFKDFTTNTEFEKWAAVEVSDFGEMPENMEKYILKGGLYAVFLYKGKSGDFAETFKYIFKTWLSKSEFELDKREHFELLGEKYKNNDPNSEEEVWIPIKKKL